MLQLIRQRNYIKDDVVLVAGCGAKVVLSRDPNSPLLSIKVVDSVDVKKCCPSCD
jgi:hypothetical protein